MIRFYRKYLSGLKGYSTCKYYPTCSQYGLEAIEKVRGFKGRRTGCSGGSCAAIHFQKADMIRYPKEDKEWKFSGLLACGLWRTGRSSGRSAWLLGQVMNGIYNVMSAIGIENIGVCIIIFTVIVYSLLLPLTIKQQKYLQDVRR